MDSHDPVRQVGAVIISADGELLAKGANKPPDRLGLTAAQSKDLSQGDPNWKYFLLEHAERNAICRALTAGKMTAGASMYSTLFPCADCARAIVAAGISRLVVPPHGREGSDEKWQMHFRYAREIFERAGVVVQFFE